MTVIKRCPNCGNEVTPGKKFCGKCGTKLELTVLDNQTRQNICPNCGNIVTPGKKFCGKCGAKIEATETNNEVNQIALKEIIQSAGFIHWNILPGQLAVKIDDQDLTNCSGVKGFVIQDGTKAIFFADGALVGELPGGKYTFKDLGAETKQQQKGLTNSVRRFGARIASFFTGRSYEILSRASSIVIVIIRDTDFPLIFIEKDMPTAGIRSEVSIHALAKISNIIQFYQTLLLDQKFVSFEKLASKLQPAIRTILEDCVNGIDPESISTNTQMREIVLAKLKQAISNIYSFISIEQILSFTANNVELERLRTMCEELYISEKELVELTRRNDFLNRLNAETNRQLLTEAQTAADFTAAMNKIDEQNQLTEDEKAKFADMLFWQRKLREAQSADEGNAALNKLEQNGLLREEEISTLKADIEQRRKLKDLTDGQNLAMLTMQNEMALDAQKLQWEIEVGNKRLENELNTRRAKDSYTDERRRAEMELEKEELENSMNALRQIRELNREEEDHAHRLKMEEENAAREYERAIKTDEQKHEEEMRRMLQNLSAEQIIAINPNVSPEVAAAFAEKFKNQSAQEQIELVNKHSEEIRQIMTDNSTQQQATLQQLMQMMEKMFGAQNANKESAVAEARREAADIRKDANEHQDRMTEMLKTQTTAAFNAAGKILSSGNKITGNNSVKKTICPNCGAEIENGASFCSDCGNSL